MTVTKQQQLEYLAKECHSWRGRDFILVSDTELGYRLPVSSGCHLITQQEWQQERDKIGSKPVVDNSWHERGELPPVGIWCEVREVNGWLKTFIVGFDEEGYCVYRTPWNEGVSDFDADDCHERFRPLRTEREKAIDEACKAICGVGEDGLLIIERIYDAGLLK